MLQQSLLSSQSAKERESKKLSEEILSLLSQPTAKVICVSSSNTCDENLYILCLLLFKWL